MWAIRRSTCCSILIGAVLLGMVQAACDNQKAKTHTVGVMNVVQALDQTVVGFKEGMAELGYVEGKNVRYLYNGATRDISRLSATAQTLLAAKVDLILTITTPATLAAKQATAGTGLPVVFAVATDPVGAGIVDSMQHPGGHITGVAFGIQEARRIEWLVRIAPKIRHIYVPFNPKDQSPVLALKMVRTAAAKLGVELITREVHDAETLNDAILNIPGEADAVFLLPDSLMTTRLTDMVTMATKRNLPVSAANVSNVKSDHVLTAFGIDLPLCGKQAARLADQIFKGARPADLPVEIAEFYLAINLKVAETIGIAIPDEILRQADMIIR
ncbi:MAG: ABC transporter substrate-binding protein [Thermodesulfobacteriota bacterium]